MSHYMVAFFALVMAIAGLIFFYIGVSLGWLYTFMGVILGSAVVPIALAVTWSKASKWGCIAGAVGGFAAGIIAWLVTTSALNGGVINVNTSGGDLEMLAGNLASIGVGGLVSYFWSLIAPENFDFDVTRAINQVKLKTDQIDTPKVDEEEKRHVDIDRKLSLEGSSSPTESMVDPELDPVALNKAFKFAAWSSVALLIVFLLVIPLPLFFASTVFGVRGLSAWVIIEIIWTFLAAFTVILYPLWESKVELRLVAKGMFKDLFNWGSGKYVAKENERDGV